MIDEKRIKEVEAALDRDMDKELMEALKPEPTEGSRDFHTGSHHGLKQVLEELLGPNKDQWDRWKVDPMAMQTDLKEVLFKLTDRRKKAADELVKPDNVRPDIVNSSYRDFQAGIYHGLQRGIDLIQKAQTR